MLSVKILSAISEHYLNIFHLSKLYLLNYLNRNYNFKVKLLSKEINSQNLTQHTNKSFSF